MGMGVKFRAWDKENKKMFKIARFDFSDYTIYSHSFACDGYLGESCEIMQYTGLKDKNGVKIYEGDVVENENGKVGYVVFLIQEAGFVVVLKDRDYRLGHRNTGEGYYVAGNHKVIGNVYSNPELLEEG